MNVSLGGTFFFPRYEIAALNIAGFAACLSTRDNH
jgi:hypothetical protein